MSENIKTNILPTRLEVQYKAKIDFGVAVLDVDCIEGVACELDTHYSLLYQTFRGKYLDTSILR